MVLFCQAFGVGALEDDDEDIYNTDHMSNYDITMAEEDDENFGWTAPRGKGTLMFQTYFCKNWDFFYKYR